MNECGQIQQANRWRSPHPRRVRDNQLVACRLLPSRADNGVQRGATAADEHLHEQTRRRQKSAPPTRYGGLGNHRWRRRQWRRRRRRRCRDRNTGYATVLGNWWETRWGLRGTAVDRSGLQFDTGSRRASRTERNRGWAGKRYGKPVESSRGSPGTASITGMDPPVSGIRSQ